jgi:hypothetical protein
MIPVSLGGESFGGSDPDLKTQIWLEQILTPVLEKFFNEKEIHLN